MSSLFVGAVAPTLAVHISNITMKRPEASVHTAEPPRLFARLPTVIQATGLGRSTIYRLVATGAFPAPVHLGPRAVAWRWSDLDQWSQSRRTGPH
jgi:prophage regulatory protein